MAEMIEGKPMKDIRAEERRLIMLYFSTLSRGEDTTKRMDELNAYRQLIVEDGIEPLSLEASEFESLYAYFMLEETENHPENGQNRRYDMYLSENLRILRTQRGLTQAEMAKVFHLKPSSIEMYESGERIPKLPMLIQMAEYFSVTLDQLVLKELKPDTPRYVRNLRYLRSKRNMMQGDTLSQPYTGGAYPRERVFYTPAKVWRIY